eukprot:3803732-Prymnesium_polylepis.1
MGGSDLMSALASTHYSLYVDPMVERAVNIIGNPHLAPGFASIMSGDSLRDRRDRPFDGVGASAA